MDFKHLPSVVGFAVSYVFAALFIFRWTEAFPFWDAIIVIVAKKRFDFVFSTWGMDCYLRLKRQEIPFCWDFY